MFPYREWNELLTFVLCLNVWEVRLWMYVGVKYIHYIYDRIQQYCMLHIVTHIGHHGCVYDIICSNIWEGTQSNMEWGNIHKTGNTLKYNTIQYIYRTVQRILFVPIWRLSEEKVAALSQSSFKLVKFYQSGLYHKSTENIYFL